MSDFSEGQFLFYQGQPLFYHGRVGQGRIAQCPALPDDQKRQIQECGAAVLAVIRRVFGLSGLNTFLEYSPCLLADLQASMEVIYQEGFLDGRYKELCVHSDAAAAGAGRILFALLSDPPQGETEDQRKLRITRAYFPPEDGGSP